MKKLSLFAWFALAMLSVWGEAQAKCEARDPVTAEINAREAVRLAKNEKYEEAVALFRMAVSLDACEPKYRLRLAKALRRSQKWDEASQCYAEIIGQFPKSSEAERAKVELEELKAEKIADDKRREEEERARQASLQPQPVPSNATQIDGSDAPESSPFPWRIVGFSVAGAGVASVVGGVVFALDSQAAQDDLKAQTYKGDQRKYDDLVEQRSHSRMWAYTLYALGGALIAGGVLAAILLPEKEEATGSSLGIYPSADGGHLVYSFDF